MRETSRRLESRLVNGVSRPIKGRERRKEKELVERFNGTLKAMLKKLCAEQSRQWHRFINALLFAYREVPQESTGFSPFELLYGRTVRGPMHILKELWTENVDVPETKTSYQYVFELREK